MKYTSNHNFKLPAPSDTIDVEVLNENFVNIDALIKTLESAKADKNSPSLRVHQPHRLRQAVQILHRLLLLLLCRD